MLAATEKEKPQIRTENGNQLSRVYKDTIQPELNTHTRFGTDVVFHCMLGNSWGAEGLENE